jgi:fibronectin-binding autotransporter adhesin
VALVLSSAMAVGLGAAAHAAPGPRCRVTNLRTGAVSTGRGLNLQASIEAARRGDALRVRGVCAGTFTIGRDLDLIGHATPAYPLPTLDGNSAGTVLTISAGSVGVRNIAITGGAAGASGYGGGIRNAGTLRLTGWTSVFANQAGFGGGIYNVNVAVLRLGGRARISGNVAVVDGGGIYNDGRVFLNANARLAKNTAGTRGGGIYVRGLVVMGGDSSIRGNLAGSSGGGVLLWEEASLVMNDASVVSHNRAVIGGGSGGGILSIEGFLTMNDTSSISQNRSVYAAGVNSSYGTVVMNDASVIWGNVALRSNGGGVYNGGNAFTMNDASSIVGNSAVRGGGVFNYGRFTLNDASTITGNAAARRGGGIDNLGEGNPSLVTMNDASSISGNTAGRHGGGIYDDADATLVGAVAGGNVVSNTPDDIYQAV